MPTTPLHSPRVLQSFPSQVLHQACHSLLGEKDRTRGLGMPTVQGASQQCKGYGNHCTVAIRVPHPLKAQETTANDAVAARPVLQCHMPRPRGHATPASLCMRWRSMGRKNGGVGRREAQPAATSWRMPCTTWALPAVMSQMTAMGPSCDETSWHCAAIERPPQLSKTQA